MAYQPKYDFLAIAKGEVPGHSFVHKFGASDAVGTTLAPICQGGFYRTPQPGSEVTLAVISSDADDNAGGAGARQVTLEYLDSNWAEQTDTIDLHPTDGTIESTDTITGVLRLLRAYVSSSGTYATQSAASQQGTLTIRVSGGGDTWAVIPQLDTGFGAGQSLIGAYTVPAGYTAYILSFEISVDSVKSVDFYFFARTNGDDVSSPYSGILRTKNIYVGVDGQASFTHSTYESYPAKTDIGFLAQAASTSDASVEFELLLVAD